MRNTLPAMMATHTMVLSPMPVAGTSVFASVFLMVTFAESSFVPEICERAITN